MKFEGDLKTSFPPASLNAACGVALSLCGAQGTWTHISYPPGLANCQAGEQQPETSSAWESAGVNHAPDLSHAESSLESVVLGMFGLAFFQFKMVVAILVFIPALQNVVKTSRIILKVPLIGNCATQVPVVDA